MVIFLLPLFLLLPLTIAEGNMENPFGRGITVEQYVTEYFSDIPIMSSVAYCESRFRQVDEDGNLFRGEVNSADVGVMQVNEYYHLAQSIKLGYDIHTLEGNLAYARWLYNKEGTTPWLPSSPCWGIENHIAMK